jgi:phosphoribosylformylglycinamidine synthase I
MRVIVLSGYGINCEDETLHAFEVVGFRGSIVHINDLILNPKQLDNYQVFAIPGGFSFGDDTGSGNAMAKKIMINLYDQLLNFISKDKLMIGICNGCQILINLGIIPETSTKEPEVALIENNTGNYECRWVDVKVTNKSSPWLSNITTLHLPVAHQEGKFMIPNNINNNYIGLQYINNKRLAKGKFPYNPNGSQNDIAALTNKYGNVLAMMPHPERALYHYHVPNWQNDIFKKYGDGYKIFVNAKNYFK